MMLDLLTPRQLAASSILSEKRIRLLIKDGQLRYLKIGSKYLVPANAVEEFLQSNMIEPIKGDAR